MNAKRLSIIIMLLLLLGTIAPVLAYPYGSSDLVVVKARNYLKSAQQSNGTIGGFDTSAWVAMAIAALGEDPHDWKKDGGPSIIDYLKAYAHLLNESKASDVERYILAMTAAGENPRNIGGKDYVTILEGLYDGTQIGDPEFLNDDFWGVMALISAGKSFHSPIIQNTVAFIKDNQNSSDYGWSWAVGGNSDVDDTAAAIMALITAKESASSTVIVNALGYIKSKQMDNGGFECWGTTNVGTDSWAIDAIVAVGQDPTSAYWTKNGKTPVNDLLTFQNPDGSFSWPYPPPWDMPELGTAYAIPALLGKPYPIKPVAMPVGGVWIAVDKFGLLAPYIGLASTIVFAAVATAIYTKRVKRKE